MTSQDAIALLPLLVLAEAAVVVLLTIAFVRDEKLVLTLTLVGLVVAFATLWMAAPQAPRAVTTLLVVDRYAVFFIGLIIAAAFVVVLLAQRYLADRVAKREEFYLLLITATLGACILVVSKHFASFFLGLELLSVSLYVMIAYERVNEFSLEAGLKYLILAGVSSAFLLYGMALIYADTGAMDLLAGRGVHFSTLGWVGFAMMLVGIGFKLALFPFHMWTPDVYQGAPAPVTAFIATVSKGAVFALILRFSAGMDLHEKHGMYDVLNAIAIASMLAGNLLGLLQTNIKRILAYSSISHMGYMLVAFLASGTTAADAVAFYLVAYFITTLGAFGCITLFSRQGLEAAELQDYQGLAWRSPWMTATFTLMLLSLAGLPLTAGFIGKFYVMTAGAGAKLWWLLIVLAISSAIGLFFYLRVIYTFYRARSTEREPLRVSPSLPGALVLCLLTILVVWIGIFPAPILTLIHSTVGVVS